MELNCFHTQFKIALTILPSFLSTGPDLHGTRSLALFILYKSFFALEGERGVFLEEKLFF